MRFPRPFIVIANLTLLTLMVVGCNPPKKQASTSQAVTGENENAVEVAQSQPPAPAVSPVPPVPEDLPDESGAPMQTADTAAADTAAAESDAESDAEMDAEMDADASSGELPTQSELEMDVEDKVDEWGPEGETPAELAKKAFAAPPNTKALSVEGRLWIDASQSRVYVDGYVAMNRGPLEMFACPAGTKEHESVVAVLAKSSEVHAALLAVEATPGTPVRFRPEFAPPTGDVIRVFVCWYDSDKQFHSIDARQWVLDLETKKAMDAEWVFAGSGFWEDPDDKVEYYRADAGDMICVSNFSSAMLDVVIPSSSDADSLRFEPMEMSIPDRETPVRLVLVPVPMQLENDDSSQPQPDVALPIASEVPLSN